MDRKESIRNAYRLTGSGSFYDGMITCSTGPGRAVCRLVWDMGKAECDAYLEEAISGIPEGFAGRLLEVPVGTGILTVPLYATLPDAEITCLDYSPDMMARAREETAALVLGQYQRLTAALILPYFGMIALILTSFWAVASGRSILPRKMALVHMLVWQIVFAGIPDLRQALGAEISTWDFVLSQGSGNAALLLWMLASALCAKQTVKGGMEHA